jgi:hypothetical protein
LWTLHIYALIAAHWHRPKISTVPEIHDFDI